MTPTPATAARLIAESRALLESAGAGRAAAERRRHGLHLLGDDADRSELLAAVARHARGLALALALSDALRARRCPHVVLKGPLLQETLYRDAGLRPYGDLDVLVDAAYAADLEPALLTLGWRPLPHRRLRALHFHTSYRNDHEPAIPLELHRSAVDRANLYRVNHREMLDRRADYPITGGRLPGLAPADQLLYLCLHAAKHGFLNEHALATGQATAWFLLPCSGNRLLWFLDLALMLETQDLQLDWTGLSGRLVAWNVIRPVATTLTVLSRLLPGSGATDALHRLALGSWQPRAGGIFARAAIRRGGRAGIRFDDRLGWRPARMAVLPELFFPTADEVARYSGSTGATWFRRAAHPVAMLRRLCRPGAADQ